MELRIRGRAKTRGEDADFSRPCGKGRFIGRGGRDPIFRVRGVGMGSSRSTCMVVVGPLANVSHIPRVQSPLRRGLPSVA